MRNKVEIDGKWYELVPLEETETESAIPTPNFYYGCDSECGIFSFTVLLNDDGDIWKGTESLVYYSEGYSNKENAEVWDNPNFLNAIIDDNGRFGLHDYEIEAKELIEDNLGEFKDLQNLLRRVRDKGWLEID